jgi:hypothetical protein
MNMKKSRAYHRAQFAVLRDTSIDFESTLEILRVLMDAEDLEKYREEKEENADETV